MCRKIEKMILLKYISVFVVLFLSFASLFIRIIYETTKDTSSMMVVLAYHRVATSEVKNKYYKKDPWVNDLDKFEMQMKYLYEHNYKTLSMDEYYKWYKGEVNYDTKRTCVITIDDGDIENYYNVMPVLKKYNFKATIFVIGSKIKDTETWYENQKEEKYLSKELIKKMQEEYPNIEIQNHSYNLHYKTKFNISAIYRKTESQIREDFEMMEPYNMKYFAYPFGHSTKEYQVVAKEYGYRLGFSFGRGNYGPSSRKDPPYSIKRVKIDGQIGMFRFKNYLEL